MKYNPRPQHIFPRKSTSAKEYYRTHPYEPYQQTRSQKLLNIAVTCWAIAIASISIFYLTGFQG